MFSLSELNDQQRLAASTTKGPVLILAGAGSGKTRTLTYRIANLILNEKINPKNILAVSFTNKAAKEMNERVASILSKRATKGINLKTFHSLGVSILKQYINKLGYYKNFSIYNTADQLSIIKEALKNYHSDKNFDAHIIQSKISFLKNHNIDCLEYINSPYCNMEESYCQAIEYTYNYYQDKLKFYNAIDFDDILFLSLRLLKENPDISKKLSEQFKYIMIDEYQDTNSIQLELIFCLTSTHNNICVVGDDDQSIYSFRGADITNILSFEKHFKDTVVIKLEQNYRSNDKILNLANIVIKANKKRKDKKLWSESIVNDLPELWKAGNSSHEAKIVVDDLLQYYANGNFLGECAILYRSNTQTLVFEDELRLSQIPYQIFGGSKFYDKKEIKDLTAYLSVIYNQKDELAIRRILNLPARTIGLKTLQKFLKYAEENNLNLFQSLETNYLQHKGVANFINLIKKSKENFKHKSLDLAIENLIEDINFKEYIKHRYNDNLKLMNQKIKDLDYFILSAQRFVEKYQNKASVKIFLERILLSDMKDNQNDNHDNEKTACVSLMTLHSSKGLEFDRVYLVGVEENILPHKKTIQQNGDLEEERRLCYVGITRARHKLIMTYSSQREEYGKTVIKYPSRFINDFKTYYTAHDKNSFAHLSKEEYQDYKKNYFSDLLGQLKDD